MEEEKDKEQKENPPGINFTQNKVVWVIAAIILLVLAWFGFNSLISSVEDYRVTLVDYSQEIPAGTITTFTWRIDGSPATTNHTSVHLGLVSDTREFTKEVKPAETKYTDMVQDFASGNYDIPLQFIGNIQMRDEGKYFFRVHALVKDKNYWSDEYSFDVVKTSADYRLKIIAAPKAVSVVSAPKEVEVGAVTTFTWRIDGPASTTNHTAVHFGQVATPGKLDFDVKPQDTKYPDLVPDFAQGNYNIPLQFVGNVNIATAGAYFYRLHALINGKNYWSDEYTFVAKEK